ncbi:MAG: hypothetical protein BWY76_02564 [bacterium ADurb.Bin429]|nr:MAG: hypothetical protein BWY76_02564 [bacterium ADurb.Bin429]
MCAQVTGVEDFLDFLRHALADARQRHQFPTRANGRQRFLKRENGARGILIRADTVWILSLQFQRLRHLQEDAGDFVIRYHQPLPRVVFPIREWLYVARDVFAIRWRVFSPPSRRL